MYFTWKYLRFLVLLRVMSDPSMNSMFKGLITVGRELRQQHPSDLLSGGDVPRAALSGRPGAGQQITRVLLP